MKKALSLFLASALAVSMSTVAFAKVKMAPALETDYPYAMDVVAPGAEFDFNALGTNFLVPSYDGATVPASTYGVTKTEINNAKVTLKTRISKGSAAIDEVKFVYDAKNVLKAVRLVMIDPFKFNNTDGLDFEVTAYPIIDGKNFVKQGVTFTGTLKNEFSDEEVDKDTTYFDMSDGAIMKPLELVKSMEYYLGEDVSLFGRSLKGTKYWGVANTDASDADDANILKYDLDGVFHVDQINLESVASYVTLGGADATHYIYDGDMKYLGRGNDRLPFSSTYYLSAKELDTDTTEEEPTDEESVEEEIDAPNPGTGADDSYPTNVNDNPGTGR